MLVSLNDVIPHDAEFLTIRDCALNQRGRVAVAVLQAFLCVRPKHEFLLKTIDLIISHVKEGYYGFEPTCPTGPLALGLAINLCLQRYEYTPHTVGLNYISNFNYIIWPPLSDHKICTNEKGVKIINYEYDTYRLEQSSNFKKILVIHGGIVGDLSKFTRMKNVIIYF